MLTGTVFLVVSTYTPLSRCNNASSPSLVEGDADCAFASCCVSGIRLKRSISRAEGRAVFARDKRAPILKWIMTFIDHVRYKIYINDPRAFKIVWNLFENFCRFTLLHVSSNSDGSNSWKALSSFSLTLGSFSCNSCTTTPWYTSYTARYKWGTSHCQHATHALLVVAQPEASLPSPCDPLFQLEPGEWRGRHRVVEWGRSPACKTAPAAVKPTRETAAVNHTDRHKGHEWSQCVCSELFIHRCHTGVIV